MPGSKKAATLNTLCHSNPLQVSSTLYPFVAYKPMSTFYSPLQPPQLSEP